MLDATEHHSAYRQTFGGSFRVAPGALPSRLVAVLFTNRSGSMLFTEMIGSSRDIITNYEVFNGAVVRTRSREWGLATFPGYLTRIFGRPKVTYTAKIHAAQLGVLAGAGLLQAFAGGIAFYRVRRRDRVAQAVSHSIARQTGRWTSFAGGAGDARGEPVYDFAEISSIHRTIAREEAHLDRLSDEFGLRVQDVVFEDFLEAPQSALHPAWAALGVRPGCPDLAQTRHRRQADGLNRDFIRHFQEDLARNGGVSAA